MISGTLRLVIECGLPLTFFAIQTVRKGAVYTAVCRVFDTGDIMVGLEPVNGQWWHATLSGVTGIIPLTHVTELHPSEDGPLCNLWSPAALPSNDLKLSLDTSGLVGTTVVADSDLTAQLDYELTFSRGDVVYVLEDLGDGFAIGQCNGSVGQFPLCFCTPTDPDATGVLPSPEKPPSINAPTQSSSPTWKRSSVRTGSYTLANTRSQDCSVIAYCSTLYEFRDRSSTTSELDLLSFGAGEIVHLISHLDEHWCYGELDGNCGAFPTSYVDIIVDCDVTVDEPAPPKSETEKSAQPQFEAMSSEPVQPKRESEPTNAITTVPQTSSSRAANRSGIAGEMYGRLVCDFVAINVNEVDASEGETVTVLHRINDEWLEVRHDNGRVGLCPASFVELFGAEPEPEPTTKPDVRTPPVVKPKLPVKPKSLTATKTQSTSPSNFDGTKKSPIAANPPESSIQPVAAQPDNSVFSPTVDDSLSSPKTEAVKSPSFTSTASPTHSFFTPRQPPSRALNLDELIQAQMTSAKSASPMPAAGRADIEPSDRNVGSDGATLNGVADVAGQSSWYTFSDSQHVSPPMVTRKPPPPPRPAPSRLPPTSFTPPSSAVNYGSKNGLDVGGPTTQRKPPSNLIEFSPDHYTGKQCRCLVRNIFTYLFNLLRTREQSNFTAQTCRSSNAKKHY